MDPEQLARTQAFIDKNFGNHQESKRDALRAMNNIIFVITTGTFVLSITFIAGIDAPFIKLNLLMWSWGLLILTIFGNLAAHYSMILHSDRSQKILNEFAASGSQNTMEATKTMNEDPKLNFIGRYVMFGINSVVITALLGGLIFLFLFIGSNLIAKNDLEVKREIDLKLQSIENRIILLKERNPSLK